jgi:hypothetical protein
LTQAGVPSVVGTLWSVNDASTALLMVRFYELLLQDKLAPPEALRRAQCWLRDATNADLDAYLSHHEAFALARQQQAERMPLSAVHTLLGPVLKGDPNERPYAHPYYWAPFVFYGAEVWPRLPDLAGVNWPAMYWQLVDLLRAFRRAEDDQQRAGVAIRIQRLLASVPEVRAAWAEENAVLVRKGDVVTRSGAFVAPATEDDVWAAVDDLLQTAAVTRWTDVLAPGRVQSGSDFAVIVGLTCQDGEGEQAKPMSLLPGQTVRVVLAATELEVIGPRAKELRVLADRDSDPVVFFVRAPQPGSYRVMLDFWVDQHVAASVSYVVDAVEAPAEPSGATAQPDVLVPVGPARVPYPDLVLRVTTAGNRLRFDLNYADTHLVQIEGERLRADPETFRYELLKEIERLAAETGKPLDFLVGQMEKIGQRLYRDLFPAELRREYRRFCEHVHTLQIVSDEPWIPWELIKPYDDEAGQPLIDHDFLCMQFDLARWVCPAPSSAAAEIAVDTLTCIVPSDSGLAEAQGERDDLTDLAAALGLTLHVPAPADLAAVEMLLRGSVPIQLWHFACHGDVNSPRPASRLCIWKTARGSILTTLSDQPKRI